MTESEQLRRGWFRSLSIGDLVEINIGRGVWHPAIIVEIWDRADIFRSPRSSGDPDVLKEPRRHLSLHRVLDGGVTIETCASHGVDESAAATIRPRKAT